MQALKIPNIINFALSYACLKSLAYALSMWLPFYLDSKIHKEQWVGTLASLLDLGAICGSIACGWLGDKYNTRPPFISLYLLCSLPCIFLLSFANESMFWSFFIIIPLCGFCVGGANLIMSSAVAVDIAQNGKVSNLYETMATVAGIIDGSGGIGAAIGTFLVGSLAYFNWLYVFGFMILMGLTSFLCIFKITLREIYRYRNTKMNVNYNTF